MIAKFWGVRGSIPSPPTSREIKYKLLKLLELAAEKDISTPSKREEFIKNADEKLLGVLGGNTPCVELRVEDKIFIFDMGSGLREFGQYLISKVGNSENLELHIFIGHTHWDHIHGFPFFLPAFHSKTTIHFYHLHPQLKERLEVQQDFRFFPVSLDFMASKRTYTQLELDSEIMIGKVKIRNIELNHPGRAFGYRVEYCGKSFVYASDSEYSNLPPERIQKYIDFYSEADLLIFDAPYSFNEELEKINWGHSSALVGIDISVKAKVKNLALFHHAPENGDHEVFKLLDTAMHYKERNYPHSDLKVFLAREGMEYDI